LIFCQTKKELQKDWYSKNIDLPDINQQGQYFSNLNANIEDSIFYFLEFAWRNIPDISTNQGFWKVVKKFGWEKKFTIPPISKPIPKLKSSIDIRVGFDFMSAKREKIISEYLSAIENILQSFGFNRIPDTNDISTITLKTEYFLNALREIYLSDNKEKDNQYKLIFDVISEASYHICKENFEPKAYTDIWNAIITNLELVHSHISELHFKESNNHYPTPTETSTPQTKHKTIADEQELKLPHQIKISGDFEQFKKDAIILFSQNNKGKTILNEADVLYWINQNFKLGEGVPEYKTFIPKCNKSDLHHIIFVLQNRYSIHGTKSQWFDCLNKCFPNHECTNIDNLKWYPDKSYLNTI
jgi:hypothetical protein